MKECALKALELVKSNKDEICMNLETSALETTAFTTLLNPIHCYNSIDDLYVDYNIDLKETDKPEFKVKFLEDIVNITASINEIFKDWSKYSDGLKIYIFYLLIRNLIVLCFSNEFFYRDTANNYFKELFRVFYKIFTSISTIDEYFPFRVAQKIDAETLRRIVLKFNDFIAVFLFQLADSKYQEQCDLKLLKVLLKVFNIFYELNDRFKVIDYRTFYNASMNESFDLSSDYKAYVKMLQKKGSPKNVLFLKYPWLFDSASKKNILAMFHESQMHTEIRNTLFLNKDSNYLKMDVMI